MTRTTQEVIDQAIKENRKWEIALLVFAVLFVLLGTLVIVWSVMQKQSFLTLAGSVESGLFWPASALATRTRKDNIMLRMLELPLGKTKTAAEAADMLQRVFAAHFLQQPSKQNKAVGV